MVKFKYNPQYYVLYEIILKTAFNKGVLVSFHYYGIYDETDYSNLHIVKGNTQRNK